MSNQTIAAKSCGIDGGTAVVGDGLDVGVCTSHHNHSAHLRGGKEKYKEVRFLLNQLLKCLSEE